MGEEGERSRRNREDKRQLSERHAPPEAALTTRPAASALQALLAQADPAAPRGDSQGMSLKDDASCGTSIFFSFGGGRGNTNGGRPERRLKFSLHLSQEPLSSTCLQVWLELPSLCLMPQTS